MKFTSKIASLLVLLAGLAGLSFGQAALNSNHSFGAVSGPALYSGTSSTISGSVTLAACTGIAAPLLPGTPSSIIYVGREAMGVFTVNGCTLGVIRGYLGTQASPHPSGDMVLYGPNYAVTWRSAGIRFRTGSSAGPALWWDLHRANTPTTPWVNVLTGAQWLCSSITGTWVPGWQNPWAATSTWGQTATVASAAAAITPSGPLLQHLGNRGNHGLQYSDRVEHGFGRLLHRHPTGIWTWTAAGNIATAGTGPPRATMLTFCWSWSASKWVPPHSASTALAARFGR
jgi:hypothetical protein